MLQWLLRESQPLSFHPALDVSPSWTSRPSQLLQCPLIAPNPLLPYPSDPPGWLDSLGLIVEPPRSRGSHWRWLEVGSERQSRTKVTSGASLS